MRFHEPLSQYIHHNRNKEWITDRQSNIHSFAFEWGGKFLVLWGDHCRKWGESGDLSTTHQAKMGKPGSQSQVRCVSISSKDLDLDISLKCVKSSKASMRRVRQLDERAAPDGGPPDKDGKAGAGWQVESTSSSNSSRCVLGSPALLC